jgi:hypothetical protein
MKIGKDAVVIGNVPPHAEVGDGSVIIGATDAYRNTIITQSMAVGRGAMAGPGSIAIGAFAGAGLFASSSRLSADVQRLRELVAQQNSETITMEFEKLRAALAQANPRRSVVMSAWEGVKAAAAINGAYSLLSKLSDLATYFTT